MDAIPNMRAPLPWVIDDRLGRHWQGCQRGSHLEHTAPQSFSRGGHSPALAQNDITADARSSAGAAGDTALLSLNNRHDIAVSSVPVYSTGTVSSSMPPRACFST